MSGIDRRRVLALSGAAALAAAPLRFASAATLTTEGDAGPIQPTGKKGPLHALTVFGNPKHGPDFKHFDYVNADAPKGGSIRLLPSQWTTNQNPTTFNTFNMHILRGDAPPLLELIHASLMVRGWDEPDAVYGLLAEAVTIDGRDYAFKLRDGATFTDGSPITAADVVFTFETLKAEGHPIYRQVLGGVEAAREDGADTAVITFAQGTSNRLPPLVTVLPIISKAYYTENSILDANLDVPVSSGAYTVGDFRAGRFVSLKRRDDDWLQSVPSRVGHHNFDEVRVDFYRERVTSFEAFKKGDVTFREEFTSKTWATEYNFPAVEDGRVIRATMPDDRPAGAQGAFFNTRRSKFADPRTREAIAAAFDFEWTNENLFYGLYTRTPSFFVNSDMMATGEPTPAELTLLEPYRGKVPDGVFGPAWEPVKTDGTGRDRRPLQMANKLLQEAGWRRQDDGLVNDAGERLDFEFLYFQPSWERILQPFTRRLALLGINATLRLVESAQYQSRINVFDFDVTTRRYSMSLTPGELIREYWTSSTANVDGSFNLAGISDPVVDDLTEKLINSPNREEMVTAARALDRVLRFGHYWVPQWYKGSHTIAYWDQFGFPQKPRYDLPVATTWWAKDA